MKIRNKILLYFSATSIVLVGILFIVVYFLFFEYREEDFQQRQKEKITTTLRFISEVENDETKIIEIIDRLTINSFIDEKLLIFDSTKSLIYASLDDVPILYSEELLKKLNAENVWIEQKDGDYDVVAIHFKSNQNTYYGISKAYDEFGYTKLHFLRNILFISFIVFTILVSLIAVFFANRIALPITRLAHLLGSYKVGETVFKEPIKKLHTHELDYLNGKFYELVNRANSAYIFQKNSIHHISHQLKTPIAVLVSELERIKSTLKDDLLKKELDAQIAKTNSLAEIINTLLKISKIETEQNIEKRSIRIDDLIFDSIQEVNTLFPDFVFEVNYLQIDFNTEELTVLADEMLLKQAIQNLLNNCIAYSNLPKAEIKIMPAKNDQLKITFINDGEVLTTEEEAYLFSHFFRGNNSRNKIGFGLGLALTDKIINYHGGKITYQKQAPNKNIFTIELPVL